MAVKAGALITNPAQSVSTPKYSTPEMDFYSEHEISQLLLAVNGTSLEALIQIAITTGMRQSEILALKWSDLDLNRNTITIQRQLRRKHEDRNLLLFTENKCWKENNITWLRYSPEITRASQETGNCEGKKG